MAPGATTIALLPASSTVISATPEGASDVNATYVVSTPSSRKLSRDLRPNTSLPSRATKDTFAPSLAAATAWLAPLPPGTIRKSPPRIVSPGTGIRADLTTRSMFELPTTTM